MAIEPRQRRIRALLVIASLSGLGLASVSLVRGGSPQDRVPPGAVAVVNGRPIGAALVEDALVAMAGDRRDASLPTGERGRVIDRLIDEELLLERTLQLELPRTDPMIRRQLVASLVASVAREGDVAEPDRETLSRFFAANQDRFRSAPKVVARAAFVRVDERRDDAAAHALAVAIAERARGGEPLDGLGQSLGDPLPLALPEALPASKLRDYLGPTPAHSLSGLMPGEVAEPARGAGGYYVVQLIAREAGEVGSLDDVRDQVLAEYRRDAGERAVERYLAELRREARIRVREPGAAEPRASGD